MRKEQSKSGKTPERGMKKQRMEIMESEYIKKENN